MVVVIVTKDAMGVAFGIVELPFAQHPPEREKAKPAQKQRDRDQYAEDIHQRNLSAFNDTVKDEEDIARAAIRGEHRPATASGTANRL